VKKTLSYGARVFSIAWQANGFYALLSLLSKLYDSTLYPLTQVILLATLLDLFQEQKMLTFNDLSWIILVYLTATLLKQFLKSFLDVKENYLLNKF